jgi:diacylglycerol kinase family enzyme
VSARRPVLIVNPRSGGGKAVRHDLVGRCRELGIDTIVFEPGDDLSALATDAVRRGADVLGMAGGDGSQAVVARVAAEHGVPFVCVPAGTRNHFAFDIGVDRGDIVGALDAFRHGEDRRIDLARVNGRVFVNNVALGVYGAAVQSPEYRDKKVRTVLAMLPELIGPQGQPFDLRFVGPDGEAHDHGVLLLVSNNPYDARPRAPVRGTRGRLDRGVLGVVAVFGPPPRGALAWSATTFRIESHNAVAAGIDGEQALIEPPLEFESLPLALTVRVRCHGRRR